MEIKNNKDEVPFQHYLQQFQQLDPEDAVRRLELPFDGNAFTLRFLNETYAVTWPEYAISSGDPNAFALGRLQARPSSCAICWWESICRRRAAGKPSGSCPGARCTSSPSTAGASGAAHSPSAGT